ncbi:hypothetical protein NLU13_5756 [Sarocladium strictum]|uniref:Transcription factor TFIIIC triple barrel domain-containing protein n=1 Tax=Sarocladium strictum TaxID=5046 RepID=A0AA39GJ75_SARSR|nr:hypothetical protein NLU13_5756 [Sarocladium strictum]
MADILPSDALLSALQVDEILEQISQDDQEEWEYEYSTTETETFYLTLDLSHPDFVDRREKFANYSRGGYYKAKPVKSFEKSDVDKTSGRTDRDHGVYAGEDDDDDDNDDDHMHEAEDADEEASQRRREKGKAVDRGPPGTGGEVEEDHNELREDIQILDLHSPHPLILYRGRVFEGDWAEMIGTEIILTKRDGTDMASNPALPALRNLEDGIDLLAASASKILTREKVIKPIISTDQAERQQALEDVKKEWSIRIPLAKKDKEGEKGEQARFLENLMALKKKKGETDNVTVYARPAGEERREPTFKRPRGDSTAKERTPARRRARKTGPRWNRAGTGLIGAGVNTGNAGEGAGEGSSLSTPTPLRWDDLRTPKSEAASRDRRDGEEHEDEDVQMSG